MKNNVSILVLLTILLGSCGSGSESKTSTFTLKESSQGIELFENGTSVFFYQREPKSGNGVNFFNNYLHPVYSLNGDTLTEEFPADHFHHRGIFWAWHQLFIDDQSLGDGWMMENIKQDVSDVQTELKVGGAVFTIKVLWHSSTLENADPFLDEQTTITVYPLKNNMRIFDFEISLNARVEGLQLGGSDDEKGYGGFSARIKMPDDLVFTSANGPVNPQNLQIQAGPWMDFSGSLGRNQEISGVTILCHPDTPNYPAPWILRQTNSMQNIVFPGREKVEITMEKPLILRYRMIIHKGNADSLDIELLRAEYEGVK